MSIANRQQPTRFRTSSTDDRAFQLILLDVLFFPYLPGLPITLSMIAVITWPILSPKRLSSRYFILSIVLILLAILSFLRFLAFSAPASNIYIITNIINVGVLCFMAILILMIVSIRNRKLFLINNQQFIIKILKLYILFKFVLALIFFASPSQYFSLRSFWTYSDNTIHADSFSIITRFTGTLSDPNNYACIMVAAVAFVVFRQPEKLLQNIGIIILASLSIAGSMSVTGISAFLLLIIIYILFAKLPGRNTIQFVFKLSIIITIPIVLFLIFQMMQDNIVIQLALYRVTESSAESRFVKFEIFTDVEKLLRALIVGEGPTIIWNNKEFRPHIGHLYILFGFGLPAYVIFIFSFFPISFKKPLFNVIFLLPIFLGFSLNVGIYEPRFAAIWAILVGLYFIEPTRANSSLGGGMI